MEPAPRLAFYIRRPPEDWEQQQLTYPKDYAEDFGDFETLQERYRVDPAFRAAVDAILAEMAWQAPGEPVEPDQEANNEGA